MLVCFLACVKSGKAYCPIDYSVPLNRVEAIIKELNPEIILTTETLLLTYKSILTLDSIISIARKKENLNIQKNYVSATDVFYIIFTSGSTGIPKGVQITRDCLDNFIKWAVTLGKGFDDKKHYVFINQAPFSFDLSVMDLYLSLYTAGTLWVINKEIQNNMKFLLESFKHSNANVWVSTPSFADICLADKNFSKELLPHLHTFLFCGETLTNHTAEQLLKVFPEADIINTYGPTESTVAVTEIQITPEINIKWNPLPVGKKTRN